MRAIWKGSLSFGLVNVPVKLFAATEDHDLPLHQVHDKDGGRIKYQRRCEVCGRIIPFEHIDKAYEDGDETIVLTADELSSLPAERSHDIDVVEFVPSDQVDPIRFDRSYFLAPDSKSIKAYVLLRRTLESTRRTAIVQLALRQKSRLAALRVQDDVLLLQTLLWDDEVRQARFPELDEHPRISAKELEMSSKLVEGFSADFDPSSFSDDYQAQLKKLVDAKLKAGESVDTEATFGQDGDDERGGEVLDLMEALRQSVDRRKKAAPSKTAAKKTGSKVVPRKSATKTPSAKKKPAATKKPAAEKKPTAKRAG